MSSRRCKYTLRWGKERREKYRTKLGLNVGEAWKPGSKDDPRESGELYWRAQAELEAEERGEEYFDPDNPEQDRQQLSYELELWAKNPNNPLNS